MPLFWDWVLYYEPALVRLLNGGNPYDVPGFFSPVHALLPLVPFRALRSNIGLLAALTVIVIAVYGLSARNLNKSTAGTLLMVTNVYTLNLILSGNAEWLAWLGLCLPLSFGLIWLVTKPQTMIGYIAYRLWRRFERRGLVGVALAVLPTALIAGWGVWRYGLPHFDQLPPSCVNAWWPWTIAVGVALVGLSIWRRDGRLALAAGPLMAPHVCPYGWAAVLAPFEGGAAAMVMVATWIYEVVMSNPV